MTTAETFLLKEAVKQSVKTYFEKLDGAETNDLYELVISTVEESLLKVLLERVRDNQSKASQILGLSRGNVRTKLKKYGFIKGKEK